MKKFLHLTYLKHSVLIIVSVIFTFFFISAQQRQISLSGFNSDVIADAGLNQTDLTLITSLPLDAPPGDVLFAQGYSNNATAYPNGLPANGQIVSPAGDHFQLAPYNDDNDLRMGQGDFGTLAFSVPDRLSYDSLLVLAANTGGGAPVDYLIYFTDNSTSGGTLTISDWLCVGCTNYAINNLSKIDRTSGAVSGTNQYALYKYAIHLSAAQKLKQVSAILFTAAPTGTTVTNIFGVTGIPFAPLPVSLVYYDAKINNGTALLQWKTAQEFNNKNYIIERAGNTAPDIFVQVGTVAANSAANGSIYNFSDAPGASGTYLYRLTQVDIDGKKTVLGIRSVTINGKAVWVVQDLGTQWRLTSAEAFTYRLVDMNGSVLKTGIGSAGSTTISKPSAKGIYIIQVQTHGALLTQRVIN